MAEIKQLKAVDFFCCAGGVTNGFRRAGIKVLGGIDIEGAYKETYEKNNIGSIFIEADIAKLEPQDLEKRLNIKKKMDDLIFVGCSPCQFYTIMQTDKSKSSKGRLLLEEFRRFVEYFTPGYIFIENVPGLETKEGSPLSHFKEFLQKNNYVIDDRIVNASDYNVAQNRRRYVLIATRIKSVINLPVIKEDKKLTVRNLIGNEKFPKVKAGNKDETNFQHIVAGLQPINLERIINTPKNGGTRLSWKDNDKLQLPCYIGRDNIFSDVYGRMHWDYPAPTITTKFFSISNGRFGHPEQNRAISLREGATLQSFPINYKFYGNSISCIARMIGNAVPPNMAKGIGEAIINNYKIIN